MKMRELEAETGVNRETIRVYIREGLIPQPLRRARNSADYDDRHVRGIKAIRKLQEASSLTLPQIKSIMAGEQSERPVGARGLAHLEELVSSRVGVRKGRIKLSALESNYPMARSDAKALERIGVIDLVVDADDDASLSMTDAGLIDIWARMREVGFDEEHGFPPDILSYYVEAAEIVAGQEAHIFLEQVQGRMSEAEAAAMLEFALPAMLEFFGIIRQRIFLRNIAGGSEG